MNILHEILYGCETNYISVWSVIVVWALFKVLFAISNIRRLRLMDHLTLQLSNRVGCWRGWMISSSVATGILFGNGRYGNVREIFRPGMDGTGMDGTGSSGKFFVREWTVRESTGNFSSGNGRYGKFGNSRTVPYRTGNFRYRGNTNLKIEETKKNRNLKCTRHIQSHSFISKTNWSDLILSSSAVMQ